MIGGFWKTNLLKISKDEHITVDYKGVFNGIKFLPDDLKNKINEKTEGKYDKEHMNEIRQAITEYLTQIIKKSSLGQTKKGILTTGPVNSISYAIRKLKKGRKK